MPDDWFTPEISHSKNGEWSAKVYYEYTRNHFLQITATGDTPEHALALLERAVVQEFGQVVRNGPGRRAYDQQRSFLDAPYEAPISDMGRRAEDRGL